MPTSPSHPSTAECEGIMDRVRIGVDPHKLSATIEVVDRRESILGSGRFTTDKAGYAAMRKYASQWPDREWAVEGGLGVGRPLAQRLLEDGERVVDIPAKLAARARVLDTGHGRKTDAHDAHAVAVAAVRAKRLRVLAPDGQLEALRMLVDQRDQLSSRRVQTVNRLHCLLAELTPGKAKKDLTALQAKAILASVRPRDIAGKTRRQVAADALAELLSVEKKVKTLTRQIDTIVEERGSHLKQLPGVGPVVAARILADVGDVARFADRNRFASWTGTAPLDASSCQQTRHRLSRAGNRRMNRALHIAATTQIRLDTEGRAYYRHKLAAGKSRMEAMRCLKRRISDAVYRQLVADAQAAQRAYPTGAGMPLSAGPGGHSGATLTSSAVDLSPHIDTSDQPLPGPAQPTLPSARTPENPRAASAPRSTRRRAGAVKVERPTGRTTLTATSADAHSREPKPRS
jgi:transposase